MGEITDLIFSLLGKSGRLFNAHGKRVCFIIWTGCLLYWIARNYQLGLKVQVVSCFVSILLHIYSYYQWSKKKKTVGVKFEQSASILNDQFVINLSEGDVCSYDADGNMVFCGCGKLATHSIIGKDCFVNYCKNCDPVFVKRKNEDKNEAS